MNPTFKIIRTFSLQFQRLILSYKKVRKNLKLVKTECIKLQDNTLRKCGNSVILKEKDTFLQKTSLETKKTLVISMGSKENESIVLYQKRYGNVHRIDTEG